MDFEKQTTDKNQMQPEFQDVSLVDSGKEKNPQYSSAKSDWTQPVYDDIKKKNPEDFFVATCEGDTQTTGTNDLGKTKDTIKDANMFKGQEPLTGGNGSKMAETGTTLGGTEQKLKDTKKDKDISKKDKDAKKNKEKLKGEEKEKEKMKDKEKEMEKEKKKGEKKFKGEEREKEKKKGEKTLTGGEGSTMEDATKIPLKKGKSKNGGNGSKMADIKEAVGTEFREDKDKTNRDINIGREQTGQREMETNLLNKDKDQKLTSDLSQQREGDLLNRQSK